jgi:hypothetical protein
VATDAVPEPSKGCRSTADKSPSLIAWPTAKPITATPPGIVTLTPCFARKTTRGFFGRCAKLLFLLKLAAA